MVQGVTGALPLEGKSKMDAHPKGPEGGYMRSVFRRLIIILAAAGVWLAPEPGHTQESTREAILDTFYPYREGFPTLQDLEPGLKLDSTNAQVLSSVLPAELLKYLSAGDFGFTIQQTTDFPTRQAFIDATLIHHQGVVVGREELQNYVAGRPFPVLDANDPDAGLKAIWNHRYRDQGDIVETRATMDLVNGNGAIERSQDFSISWVFGMHRPDPEKNVAQWERHRVFAKRTMLVLAPSDIEGSQFLDTFWDNASIPLNEWAYDPKTRRTRKIAYNPYISPDRGVMLIEDQNGFMGYIGAYNWKYLGKQTVLAPGPIHTPESTYGGKGGWYFVDPWELRRALVVEGTPTASHPLYSRRVLYLDQQTYLPLFTLMYDHAGEHKRTQLLNLRHPDYNPWGNDEWFGYVAGQTAIDYQLERASRFRVTKILFNRALSPTQFTVMSLLLRGK